MNENFIEFQWLIRRLAAAVLEQAVQDLFARRQDKKHKSRIFDDNLRREARRWFDEKTDGLFSYKWCLQYANINPNAVRKYLNKFDKDFPELAPGK